MDKQKTELLLLPKVKKLRLGKDSFRASIPFSLILPEELAPLHAVIKESYGKFFSSNDSNERNSVNSSGGTVVFERDGSLGKEGYCLIVGQVSVVRYSEINGAFYALMTLCQLLCQKDVPNCEIEDEPSISLRGYLLDVSRGKIPKISALKELIDLLAFFKYNHLELYFEGLPFAYPSFKEHALPSAYAPEEIIELNNYCAMRCIELVPSCNSLGHMAPWLQIPKFRHLAELEEGLKVANFNAPPTTLDCENPESLDLVIKLIDELMPCFSSTLINVGLDEPFELGKGKNAKLCSVKGVNHLYFRYVKKLHESLKERGKTLLMWGDTVSRDLDTIDVLPDDVVILEWGYQAEYPFDKKAENLKKKNRKFILCPGTSSWLSVTGITDNMLKNIENAVLAAHKHGAIGLILTDWGDGGHIQCREISYPAIAYFAAKCWNELDDSTEKTVADGLNRFVFSDEKGILGKVIFDMGRYRNFEEVVLDCRTVISLPLSFPKVRGAKCEELLEGIINMTLQLISPSLTDVYRTITGNRKPTDLAGFDSYVADILDSLSEARPKCSDGEHIIKVLKNSIRLVHILTHAWEILKSDSYNAAYAEMLRKTAAEYRELSLYRNRPCGEDAVYSALNDLADNLTGINQNN